MLSTNSDSYAKTWNPPRVWDGLRIIDEWFPALIGSEKLDRPNVGLIFRGMNNNGILDVSQASEDLDHRRPI